MANLKRSRENTTKSTEKNQDNAKRLVSYLGKSDTKTLDRLIYERIRLGIVSALSVNTSLSFTELKALLNTSDGNLSTHARRLEDAAYISCKKSFSGRTPKTVYRLTAKGRKALGRYLDHMEALISATKEP